MDKANAAAEAAKARKLAAVSADQVGLGGPEPEMVERATYLLCGATQKRLHLCQDYWRGWFERRSRTTPRISPASPPRPTGRESALQEQARRNAGDAKTWQTVTNDLDQTTREIGRMHDDITAAFRGLIADGIIDPTISAWRSASASRPRSPG